MVTNMTQQPADVRAASELGAHFGAMVLKVHAQQDVIAALQNLVHQQQAEIERLKATVRSG